MSEHAFADPTWTAADTALLEAMRVSLRQRLAEKGEGGTWRDAAGDDHLLVVPSVEALRSTTPVLAIGFFGDARADVDHAPILRLEHALLDRAHEFPGFLGYYDVFFARRGQWGNLVLFASSSDAGSVAGDPQHLDSMALAPVHYHAVRLHRFALDGGALGAGQLRWLGTSYFDFDTDPPWRALRGDKLQLEL